MELMTNMLYIVSNKSNIAKIRSVAKERADELFSFTEDDRISIPIVYTKTANDELIEWFRGLEGIVHFIKYGYVFFSRKCPYSFIGKCKGSKCQLFLIDNFFGDCSIRWSAIIGINNKKFLEKK